MDALSAPISSQDSNDIFSLSDQVLSDRLQFIEEERLKLIGFGNWGSVWLCSPKQSATSEGPSKSLEQKIAVKLVHRSKTSTTAARVRSLWNEMKIVRAFKNDPHPSIIPFHSFIITPSYALITMTYLPTLVPVEVEESKSRDWLRFLLSGVEFLHKRGVVHNDIKPANILLSHKNIPVLVDFGFAEKYDLESPTAFHSNLSYGTPEYLSPERARGLPHDTRKSDVWSLGITFFEILVGRTPFENSEGEQFTTKEELEKYWSRTLRGKWIGTWNMSKSLERLLLRMISPNADLRCTATQAMADMYWMPRKGEVSAHKRSSSYTSSIVFEKDMSKMLDLTPSSTLKGKANYPTPPGLSSAEELDNDNLKVRPMLSKSKSQPKVAATKLQPRKRPAVPPMMDLSPIKASPPGTPLTSAAAKENISTFNKLAKAANATNARRPFGVLSPSSNLPRPPVSEKPSAEDHKNKRKGRALGDITSANRSNENANHGKAKESSSVRDRMREWEREKERLREMSKLEEMERERDEQLEEKKMKGSASASAAVAVEQEKYKENAKPNASSPSLLPMPVASTPLTHVLNVIPDTPTRLMKDSNRNIFRHSIKKSIDKTMQMYKASAIGKPTASRNVSIDIARDEAHEVNGDKDSWADDILFREVNSSLPVVRQAEHNERLAADSRMDRMTIWMRNVEKVVEDARQNFASVANQSHPLPPLPVAPLSRSASSKNRRASRLPRKVLAASQIFADENSSRSPAESSFITATPSSETTSFVANTSTSDLATSPAERSQFIIPEIHTPSRQRRATVSTRSPDQFPATPFDEASNYKEKSKSQANIYQMHIAPIETLGAELNKPLPPKPETYPRLSEVLDRSLFIAQPFVSRENLGEMQNITISRAPSLDDLNSSPCHVEPYPSRMANSLDVPIPDSPSQRRIEGVYDRFLMATSGVKRLGKGYQSDNAGPVYNANKLKRHSRAFYTARKPMPPPVSSEDLQRRTVSVDELGSMTCAAGSDETPLPKEENSTTAAIVRRAFKAIVPSSRRMSRMM